jgi:hypothetical protein
MFTKGQKVTYYTLWGDGTQFAFYDGVVRAAGQKYMGLTRSYPKPSISKGWDNRYKAKGYDHGYKADGEGVLVTSERTGASVVVSGVIPQNDPTEVHAFLEIKAAEYRAFLVDQIDYELATTAEELVAKRVAIMKVFPALKVKDFI